MSFQHAHNLVEQVSKAVAELRTTLENHALPGLETAILNSQMALKALEDHPGGVEGLRQFIATLPEEEQEQLRTYSFGHAAQCCFTSLRRTILCGCHLLQRGRCFFLGRWSVAWQVLRLAYLVGWMKFEPELRLKHPTLHESKSWPEYAVG